MKLKTIKIMKIKNNIKFSKIKKFLNQIKSNLDNHEKYSFYKILIRYKFLPLWSFIAIIIITIPIILLLSLYYYY